MTLRKKNINFYFFIRNRHPYKIALNLEPYGSVLIMPPNATFKIEANGLAVYLDKQLPSLEIESGDNYITVYLSPDSFSVLDSDGKLLMSHPIIEGNL